MGELENQPSLLPLGIRVCIILYIIKVRCPKKREREAQSKPQRQLGRVSETAERASEAGGRASKLADRASEAARRAPDAAGRASELALKALEPAGRPRWDEEKEKTAVVGP